jgi:hypothetical protein
MINKDMIKIDEYLNEIILRQTFPNILPSVFSITPISDFLPTETDPIHGVYIRPELRPSFKYGLFYNIIKEALKAYDSNRDQYINIIELTDFVVKSIEENYKAITDEFKLMIENNKKKEQDINEKIATRGKARGIHRDILVQDISNKIAYVVSFDKAYDLYKVKVSDKVKLKNTVKEFVKKLGESAIMKKYAREFLIKKLIDINKRAQPVSTDAKPYTPPTKTLSGQRKLR